MYLLRECFSGDDPQATPNRLAAALDGILGELQESGRNGRQPDYGLAVGVEYLHLPASKEERKFLYPGQGEGKALYCVYPSGLLRKRLQMTYSIANYKGGPDGWPDMVEAITGFVEMIEQLEGECRKPLITVGF